MIAVARDIFWRLIPANPILLRIISMAGKRRRDMLIRCGYLGLMCLWVVFMLISLGGQTDLGELAKKSAGIFENISYVQLVLVALLAPVFTAGAITQEGDSQTYDILLATPMSNGQIVLGSLLSRVFFVIALLLSGVPIFAITQIFGGVGLDNILYSFGIAAGTAFVTGAIAMALATFRIGTRRTIFGFYLFIVLYMVGLVLLDRIPFLQITGGAVYSSESSHISWFTGINPFLALRASMGDPSYLPPLAADLPAGLRFWPVGWYLTSPHTFYITTTFVLGMVLTIPSVIFLRQAAQSTLSVRNWVLLKLRIIASATTHKPRYVWHNPIAWREAKTKASAARMTWMRYALIAAGLVGAIWTLTRFAHVEMPDKYIARGAFNTDQGMLTILTSDRSIEQTYAPALKITLDGKAIKMSDLDGRYGVKDYTVASGPRKDVTTLNLVSPKRGLSLQEAQTYLLWMLLLEIAVVLIVITNVAASTVTREKEDGSLDLLLSSPITSRYYLWGKLRGLLSLALPLNLVPVASIVVFVVYDAFRMIAEGGQFQWVVFPEAIVMVPLILMTLTALGAVVGIEMSLRCRRTMAAVMISVAIVVGVVGIFGLIGYTIADNTSWNWAPLVIASFSPITVVMVIAAPAQFGGRVFNEGGADLMLGARIGMFVGSLISSGVYALIIWAIYKSMVKNFDMTIRKQSK